MTLHNLQNEAKKIKLSAQEKAVMHSQLFGVPAQASDVPVKSPYVYSYHWFSMRIAVPLSAFLIVVLGGGTAYAAQGALPGDALYPVKVGVTEKVAEALAVSNEAKIAFHAEVAQTRMEEAEELAAEGRLTAVASAQIEDSLDTHIAKVEELVVVIEEEAPEEAADVVAELDSVLYAHSSILATLGDDSDDDDTKEHSRTLAVRVKLHSSSRNAGSSEGAALAVTAKVAAPSIETMSFAADVSEDASTTLGAPAPKPASSSQIKAVEQLQKKAEKAVKEARKTFDGITSSLDATTTSRVRAQFEGLDAQLEAGVTAKEAGDYDIARITYTTAFNEVNELSAFLKAAKKYNKNLLKSLLDERFGEYVEVKVEANGEVELEKENGERGGDDSHGEVKGSATSSAMTTDDKGGERDRDDRTEEGDGRGDDNDKDNNKKEEDSFQPLLPKFELF